MRKRGPSAAERAFFRRLSAFVLENEIYARYEEPQDGFLGRERRRRGSADIWFLKSRSLEVSLRRGKGPWVKCFLCSIPIDGSPKSVRRERWGWHEHAVETAERVLLDRARWALMREKYKTKKRFVKDTSPDLAPVWAHYEQEARDLTRLLGPERYRALLRIVRAAPRKLRGAL